MSEMRDEAWESSDAVRFSIVLARDLAERLAVHAGRRGMSSRELAEEFVRRGLAELNEDDAPSHLAR